MSWNHAYTIAFKVISEGEEATFEEYMAGLRARLAQPESELREAFDEDLPYDSFEDE